MQLHLPSGSINQQFRVNSIRATSQSVPDAACRPVTIHSYVYLSYCSDLLVQRLLVQLGRISEDVSDLEILFLCNSKEKKKNKLNGHLTIFLEML